MPWNAHLPPTEWYTLNSSGLDGLVREVKDQPLIALDTETTGLNIWKDKPLFWSLAWGERRICMPANTMFAFRDSFSQINKEWIFANAKYDTHMLANVGISIAGRLIDTCVMHALLYEEQPHGLKDMAHQILGWRWNDFFDTFSPIKIVEENVSRKESIGEMLLRFERDDLEKLTEYASNDAYGTFKVAEKLKKELEAEKVFSLYPHIYPDMWSIFDKTEVPFTKVLFNCERNGIKIDLGHLKAIEKPIREKLNQLERKITQVAGRVLNPNSPKQLSKYFFEELKLKPLSMSKGGKTGIRNPSTDAAFLEHYASENEVAKLLLEHRDLSKILGTYVKGLQDRVDPFGRIHTRFNQDVARCMPAGEPVLTSTGYHPVEQVQVGDLVISHTGRVRRVIETSVHAPSLIYQVRLANGLTLRTTGPHEYQTRKRWVPAKSLTVGEDIAILDWISPIWEIGELTASFSYSPILSITSEGYAVTYGLTVEEDHSHVTGGIVTHNTGRLSSSDPNLQTIKKAEEDEFELRKAFIAEDGYEFIVADYEQLEMRLLASASMESKMISIFDRGWDIHMGNAVLVFGERHGVTYDDIQNAKKKDKKVKEGLLKPDEMTKKDHLCLFLRTAIKAVGFG